MTPSAPIDSRIGLKPCIETLAPIATVGVFVSSEMELDEKAWLVANSQFGSINTIGGQKL